MIIFVRAVKYETSARPAHRAQAGHQRPQADAQELAF